MKEMLEGEVSAWTEINEKCDKFKKVMDDLVNVIPKNCLWAWIGDFPKNGLRKPHFLGFMDFNNLYFG